MLNLSLYQKNVFRNYKSNSQIARVLTESWFSSEMYCPCCLNEKISKYPNNQKVADFLCDSCKNEFQGKSSSKTFGKILNDGEYHTMLSFVKNNLTPNFFLLHYSKEDWKVKNLYFIPKFFINESIIIKRNPLSKTARRAGWTGCNLLIERIPKEGKIYIINKGEIIDKSNVYNTWKKMSFLGKKDPSTRGWTSDVLKCVQQQDKEKFTLQEFYKFSKKYLQELHPHNKNVEAKIRQQLQILRDNGILRFDSRGTYSTIT
ncbi:restriction endonuclease [Candidatus Woesearchaeota archaeon]|nr:restriction endonuclease [Candidatus Woesearchaeota archaeon]